MTIVSPTMDDLAVRLSLRLARSGHRVALAVTGADSLARSDQALVRSVRDSVHCFEDMEPRRTTIVLTRSYFGARPDQDLDAESARLAATVTARAGVRHLVLASTTDVYGSPARPITEYSPPDPQDERSRQSLALESEVKEIGAASNMAVTCLRFPHVYGPGSILFDYVSKGCIPVSGDPSTVSSHLHVDDAAMALEAAMYTSPGDLPVSDFRPTRWSAVLELIRLMCPEVDILWTESWWVARAAKMLDEDLCIPSLITPGTGFGWRRDQAIDAAPTWRRLGRLPLFPSVDVGIPAALRALGALHDPPRPRIAMSA